VSRGVMSGVRTPRFRASEQIIYFVASVDGAVFRDTLMCV